MTTSIRFHDYNIIHFFHMFVKGFIKKLVNFSKLSIVLDNSLKKGYN